MSDKTVTLKIERDLCTVEFIYDSWQDFLRTMRKMAPLWSSVDPVDDLTERLESAIEE